MKSLPSALRARSQSRCGSNSRGLWPCIGPPAALPERAYGSLSTATARKLEQAGAYPLSRGAVKPAPPISLKPGTRLVREWGGATYKVLIHADGIEWRGQRYRSLSVVARKITGAR